MKIAVVKSTVYQDLWVCDISSNYFEIFKTSLMRCPMIGLAEEYNAEFIIVKESKDYPCQEFNPGFLNHHDKEKLKYRTNQKYMHFLDETYHGLISIDSVSHEAESIDWSKYDIVITINACIPEKIVKQFNKTTWCYYVGENEDHWVNNIIGGYDIILNQDVMKSNLPEFSIGFPYSFLGPYTIENINKKELNNDIQKAGIYIELNNTQERPFYNIPTDFLHISKCCGNIPIHIHDQNIIKNTKSLYNAKYFIKLFGRKIRGNAVLEAISAGTLVIAEYEMVMFEDLIDSYCLCNNINEMIEKINYLEENPNEYNRLVKLQREKLTTGYFRGPIEKMFEKSRLKK